MEYVWYRRFFLRDLLARGDRVVAAAPYSEWKKQVEGLGIDCIDLRLSRWGANPFREAATLWNIYRIMRTEAPDAVIFYTIKPVIYGSLVGRFVRGVRVFSLVTGLGYMFVESGRLGHIRQFVAGMLYRIALTSNEKVFFQNPDDMSVFLDNGIVKRDRTVLVPGSGVDTEFFKPAEEQPKEAHFLLVSRMIWDKGVALYVAAARRVKARYPNARFVLLGPIDDNPSAIPIERLEAWNKEGIVEYRGAADDIRPHMAECSVYVLPSWYREGIPRTNLEALAMGKPVITTNMPGCKETVLDGINGYLIPPGDEDALVNAMTRFLEDTALVAKMGMESRKLALDHFRVEMVNQTIIENL